MTAIVRPFGDAGPGYCYACAAVKINRYQTELNEIMKFLDVARRNHGPDQGADHHCAECAAFLKLPLHIQLELRRRAS